MNMTKRKATLFVDGDFLKKQILNNGDEYIPQNVVSYLTHAVQKIKMVYPDLTWSISYYGSCPTQSVLYPITETPLNELDMKKVFSGVHQIDGVPLKTYWGRMAKSAETPWIMKPQSYLKPHEWLTNDDFELNVPSKGVMTKMVDSMAAKAVLHTNDRFVVLGDGTDLKYALDMTEWMGTPVDLLNVPDKNISVISLASHHIGQDSFDKTAIKKVANSWQHMPNVRIEQLLQRIRSVTDEKQSLLMLDAGVIYNFLKHYNYALNTENVQKIMAQITDTVGQVENGKTIFYHALPPKELCAHPKSEYKMKMSDDNINCSTLESSGIQLSLGQMYQSEKCPYILKRDKWMIPHTMRTVRDFDLNIHQRDVDDRIVYDMALARFSPKIQKIYLLATDSDFVYSVQKAKESGIKVSIIQLDIPNQMSMQLMAEADEVMRISNLDPRLMTQKTQRIEDVHQNVTQKKEQLKHEQRLKRQQAVSMDEKDIDEIYEEAMHRRTKKEKIGQQRAQYRKTRYEQIKKSQRMKDRKQARR